jgi:hypothetical protein
MFDITPNDIAQLNDEQLRELVGLLCETEVRKREYPTSTVTWGGNQNAKDGGLDVRVRLAEDAAIDGYVPRWSTGFQVKSQNMSSAAISKEMCLNGVLKESIREFSDNNGAYIIVSSKGSVSDTALRVRKQAMRLALGDLSEKIFVDFYDRTRIASWVRNHHSLILKVRNMVGRAVPGWEAFGAWAYPKGGRNEEYLVENGIQIKARTSHSEETFSIEGGLNKIRDILSYPRCTVRLVGLSGVGKTRFVQALFDSRVGQTALHPLLAVYTNIGHSPNPAPLTLLSTLIAERVRAIFIIDNCPPDLHTQMAQYVDTVGSEISLITIEYDVKDDLPENTHVYEMEAVSCQLVERLLKARYANLSPIDIQTVANFSGGNSRIAIALANTVHRGGTLARLSDTALFERLFHQRRDHDRSLLKFAQASSLVYSFDGENLSAEPKSELSFISELAGISVQDAYYNVADLLERDLAQKRGKWRAILPHALGNRLADEALKVFPKHMLQGFENGQAPHRLMPSFSRRLGFLDQSQEAKAIVARWLDRDGLIGSNIWNLNDMGQTILRNCLPTNPEIGLKTIEQCLPSYTPTNPISTGSYLIKLIRLMAWDASIFDRCMTLLKIMSIHGDERISSDAVKAFSSLFQLYLSGTHATVEQRINVANQLLRSTVDREQELGIKCLALMLKTRYFISDFDFQFGARSRDYGYQPNTWEEQSAWYEAALQLADDIIFTHSNLADPLKEVLVESFSCLWTDAHIWDRIERLFQKIATHGFWPNGWTAIKQTRFLDAKNKGQESYLRLSTLEEIMRPSDLVQMVRGKILGSKNSYYDDEAIELGNPTSFHLAVEARNEEATGLGTEVAADEAVLRELMPEIVCAKGPLFYFGRGLARGSPNTERLWHELVVCFDGACKDKRDVAVFRGILFELESNDPAQVGRLLDDAIMHLPLGFYFPYLQSSVSLDEKGVLRLVKSLEVGIAPITAYCDLRAENEMNNTLKAALKKYFEALVHKNGGCEVAAQLLSTRFFQDDQYNREHAPEFIESGITLLKNLTFDDLRGVNDYNFRRVVEVCLSDVNKHDLAKKICRRYVTAIIERSALASEYIDNLKIFFKIQPRAILDILASDHVSSDKKGAPADGFWIIQTSRMVKDDLLEHIDEAVLFEWCNSNPDRNYVFAGRIAPIFLLEAGTNLTGRREHTGWTSLAARLVHAAPDPAKVMDQFIKRLNPTISSGPRSVILRRSATILSQFDTRGNSHLEALIAQAIQTLELEAIEQEKWELKFHREREESFEDEF